MNPSAPEAPVHRHEVEAIYPLSPVQEALLFGSLRSGSRDPGFLQLRCTLEGELDETGFQTAWERVIERHAVLRSSVHWKAADKRLQVVHRRVGLPWKMEDWRHLAAAQRDERLQEFLRQDRGRGLDLERAPVLRLTLFRMREREWHLVWSCHHVLLDGWSGALALSEVCTVYAALCEGSEPALPRPRPYRDYIVWLQRQDIAAAEVFWRTVLDAWSTPTPLPFDRSAGIRASEVREYASTSLELASATTAGLRDFVRDRRLTLNTLVEGAWAVLLSGYSGEPQVCFGTTTSGRAADLPGIEAMVGLFTNVLPVRVALPSESSVTAFLARLQEHHASLLRFEHTPPSQIQAWSEVPGRQRLFESLLVFENFPTGTLGADTAGQLRVRDVQGGITTSYPLTLVCAPGNTLALSLHYDRARFAPDDAARILEQLRELVERMAAAPGARLAELMRTRPTGPTVTPGSTGPNRRPLPPETAQPGFAAPRSRLEVQLAAIWETVLGVQPVGVRDDFFGLGGHSLSAAQLFERIERILGRRLPLATLFEAPTVELLARRFEDQGWAPPWSSLVPMQPDGSVPPLFCIHSYEGNVLLYHELARRLAPDQPVYGLQAIGLDGEAPPLERVQDMAEHYLREIRTVQPRGPYFLVGLCFGISVALEMAQRLHAAGEEVGELIVLDSGFWTHVPRGLRARRTAGERAQHLARELRRRWQHSVGRRFANEQTKRQLRLEAAMERAWWEYRAQPYPGRITLIRSGAYAGSSGKDWHLHSWTRLAGGGVRSHIIPGDHTAMLREPHVRELAAYVRACIRGAPADCGAAT